MLPMRTALAHLREDLPSYLVIGALLVCVFII